jgi:hypothetical protein
MRHSRLAVRLSVLVPLLVSVPVGAQLAPCSSSPPAAARTVTTVPIEVVNNHVFVRVCVNGRELQFILDTGSGGSEIDMSTAREMGIALRGSGEARGAGPGAAATAQLDNVSAIIPGTSVVVPLSGAIDFSGPSKGEGVPLQGILGYTFISQFALAIDYLTHEMRLYDAKTFRYDGPGTRAKLDFKQNQPLIDAAIRLTDGKTINGSFLVDVGSAAALLLAKPFVDKHALRTRVSPTVRVRAGGGIGGAVRSDVGRVAALLLGGHELRQPVTGLFGDSAGVFSASLWDGNIGGDVLRRFLVFFDYARKEMILERHEGSDEPFEADMSGMRMRAGASFAEISIVDVVAASPAAEAGVALGDRIVSIEGAPPTDRTMIELRQRLRRPGERVSLVLQRGDTRVAVQFTTRRIV